MLAALVLLAGLAPAGSALAGLERAEGNLRWTSHGPGGAVVSSLAIDPTDPSTLYAGVWDYWNRPGTGVYRSTDGGRSWDLRKRGLTSSAVYAVAVDPIMPTTVYAGTQSGGIFKSTDSGGHWDAIDAGIVETEVHAIVIDPVDPQTLYIAAQIHSYPPSSSLYKSTDGGVSWSPINDGLNANATSAETLAIDPSDSTTIYVGTSWDGVYKSTDAGASWQKAGNDLVDTPNIFGLVIDPLTPSTVYVTAHDEGGYYGGAVFKTTDGGANWESAMNGIPPDGIPKGIAIDPEHPATLYASAYDQDTYDPMPMFKTTDGGANWTQMDQGLFPSVAGAIVVDPARTDTVYAGMGGAGVYKTMDGAAHWRYASFGIVDTGVFALAMDPSDPDVVYAGTQAAGVFKTTSGGRHWVPVNDGLPNSESETTYEAIVIDPFDPSTVYVGTARDGVFKSTNGGTTWSKLTGGLPEGIIYALAIDPAVEGVVYAAVSGGLYKTTDAGSTWFLIGTGLPAFTAPAVLVIDPTAPSTMYAVDAGVYKSVDGGVHWRPAGHGLQGLTPQSLAVDPTDPTTLYAGMGCAPGPSVCVFKTTDGARTWVPSDTGLSEDVSALAVDPAAPSTVYAGTQDPDDRLSGEGVMRSTDGGSSWHPFNRGLGNPNILAMAIEPTGTRLHVGTTTTGVWDLTLD
jgi:photosystem II stability/assembly factor-like uncharacterized protein